MVPPMKELEEVGEVNWRSALASLQTKRRRRLISECGGHILRGNERGRGADGDSNGSERMNLHQCCGCVELVGWLVVGGGEGLWQNALYTSTVSMHDIWVFWMNLGTRLLRQRYWVCGEEEDGTIHVCNLVGSIFTKYYFFS